MKHKYCHKIKPQIICTKKGVSQTSGRASGMPARVGGPTGSITSASGFAVAIWVGCCFERVVGFCSGFMLRDEQVL